MDIGLNSEQLSLRDTVRGILRTECPPDAARQVLNDAETDPERWRSLWKTVVDLGWTELATPDPGGDFGPVELVLVLEECGAVLAPIPLLSSVGLAAGALRACGPGAAPLLADIASGRGRHPGGALPRIAAAGTGRDAERGAAARTCGRGSQPASGRAGRHAGH